MNLAKKITFAALVLIPAAAASAQSPIHGSGDLAVYRTVQSAPSYRLARPQVTVGTRITVFANFLQADPGVVLLDVAGTTMQCKLVKWKDHSVTLELPKFGINGPVDARLRIVKPNGRVAKSSAIMLVPQPRLLIHEETIPQPTPSTAGAQTPVYAEGTTGDLTIE